MSCARLDIAAYTSGLSKLFSCTARVTRSRAWSAGTAWFCARAVNTPSTRAVACMKAGVLLSGNARFSA